VFNISFDGTGGGLDGIEEALRSCTDTIRAIAVDAVEEAQADARRGAYF
jgi:cysteine synthase